MATTKTGKTAKKADDTPKNTLWRKPITLINDDDDDPLAKLYQGRDTAAKSEDLPEPLAKTPTKVEPKKEVQKALREKTANPPKPIEKIKVKSETVTETKTRDAKESLISENELRELLRIKSSTFKFTDIREILRGKSLDLYVYLLKLSGDAGGCKIKHLDLMRALDISRPTLFKQGDWLTRLMLIEKYNVPGDHLGTSYTVRQLEDVLPVPKLLVEQLEKERQTLKEDVIQYR